MKSGAEVGARFVSYESVPDNGSPSRTPGILNVSVTVPVKLYLIGFAPARSGHTIVSRTNADSDPNPWPENILRPRFMLRILKFDPGASFAPMDHILDRAFGNLSSSLALL